MHRARFNIETIRHQDYIAIGSRRIRVYKECSLIHGFGNPEGFIYFSLFTCNFFILEND